MNYNRYVVCRAMDGLGGRDLNCPMHGKNSEDCSLLICAPVQELRDAQTNAREQFNYARKMRDENVALQNELEELRQQTREREK